MKVDNVDFALTQDGDSAMRQQMLAQHADVAMSVTDRLRRVEAQLARVQNLLAYAYVSQTQQYQGLWMAPWKAYYDAWIIRQQSKGRLT